MNVINSGGWYVGNTAVLDWMDGFEEISFVKGDFDIARLENGVMDMIASPDLMAKRRMIKRNKVYCYKGSRRVARHLLGKYTRHLFKERHEGAFVFRPAFYISFYRALCSYENGLNDEEFNEIGFWKAWLLELSETLASKEGFKYSFFQNPFFYDETYDAHANIWPELFSPYKMIFVHRNPLDQFADIVKSNAHLDASSSRFHGNTQAMHPADRFFEISKKIYNARLRMAKEIPKTELIVFSFEDFLLKHEFVTLNIKNFLHIESERDVRNTRFELSESIKNIGKGESNKAVAELLTGRKYIIDELEALRTELSSLPHVISC
jgi:hypothetical protein